MALAPGRHPVGPHGGTLRIHTFREGLAQSVGHDLVIDVGQWEATVEVDDHGTPAAITLSADPRSLRVRDGRRGVKPLTEQDRGDIHSAIDRKILRGDPIAFQSSSIELAAGRLEVRGELTIVGSARSVTFELELSGDGRVSGTLHLAQSGWGIKPYRAFMGALRVRDDIEVVLDASLPSS
jgi:polyisoprenoid-binding protein YceI